MSSSASVGGLICVAVGDVNQHGRLEPRVVVRHVSDRVESHRRGDLVPLLDRELQGERAAHAKPDDSDCLADHLVPREQIIDRPAEVTGRPVDG